MKKTLSGSNESSSLEHAVYCALRTLPRQFRVAQNPPFSQIVESRSGENFKYKPDFEIIDSQGNRFLIELKSENAMSLQNMVRFIEIDRTVRQQPNTGFLILVWTGETARARYRSMTEFKDLNIYHIQNLSDISPIIENAFDYYFS